MIDKTLYQRMTLCAAGVAICGLAGGGCASLFNANSVSNQADAASASVAVLSVAPWDNYRDAVQPTFKFSPDDALALAVPNTMDLEQKVLEAFEAGAKVSLPGATLPAGTSNSQDGGRTAASLPPGTSVLGNAIGVDPILKYQAANALYQEVQIMNRYLKDAAVFEGFTPYIIRLQVSIMPRVRNLPYDAYSETSFFRGPWDTALGTNVMILPLLVTDDIESMMQSQSVDQLTQFALALSAIIEGVGVSGNLQNTYEKLQTVLGHNLNSTFMVARVSDNTIRCRFGAAYQSQSEYAMVPQTHNVTLLLLMPNTVVSDRDSTNRTVRLVAKTSLVNAKNGCVLPSQTGAESYEEMKEILTRYEVKGCYSEAQEHKLFSDLAANKYPEFTNDFLALRPVSHYTEAAWVDMISLRDKSPFSSATFTVPQYDPTLLTNNFGGANQAPLLIDDGKSATTVTLVDSVDLTASQIGAMLTVTTPEAKKLNFAANPVSVAADLSTINLSFPSLCSYVSYGKPLTNNDGTLDADLTLFTIGRTGKILLKTTNCGYVIKSSDAKPGFTMATRSSFIDADSTNGGSCQLIFSGKTPQAKIRFTVEGAEVTASLVSSTNTALLTTDGDGWIVGTNLIVKLSFNNLSPLSPVQIAGTDTSNKAQVPTITLPVIQSSGSGKTTGQ
jgi:hypothetical protein